ncbi:uncharacterized protein LOC101888664 isoform X2 [Musca domestica]|uniref:Uncharacterized protein LOC101888664 isoform X2 n=1 Tax=Musca domestica TaxID=7370 RepID=A0ABM3UWF1_MUSDO|nr:uncharacterized protein LOC101888664 isoform X2 [Musca domestica]
MSEFNSHQYYGHSMNRRKSKYGTAAAATTTSKNFNYRHVRPEYLDPGHQTKAKKNATEKSPPRPVSNIHRATTPELLAEIAALKRDTDIETHITTTGNPATTTTNAQRIRDISDEEIEELIRKLKYPEEETKISNNSESQYYTNFEELLEAQQSPRGRAGTKSPLISPSGRKKGILRKPSLNATFTQEMVEDFNQTYNLSPEQKSPPIRGTFQKVEFLEGENLPAPQVAQIIDNLKMTEYRRPQAKWVEVLEISKGSFLEEDLDESSENYDTEFLKILPPALMNEIVAKTAQLTESYVNVNLDEEIGTMDTYIVEEEETDSDFERFERENYMKYIKEKPLPQDVLNLSMDEEGSLAEFIALESDLKDLDVTYLKNPGSLHYTEVTEEDPELDPQLKVYIKTDRDINPLDELPQCSMDANETFVPFPEDFYSHYKNLHKAKEAKIRTLREQHLQRTFERLAAGGGGAPSTRRSHSNCSRSQVEIIQSQRSSSKAHTNRSTFSTKPQAVVETCSQRGSAKKSSKSGNQSNRKNLKVSKSIEDLKVEKTNIYKKMSGTQEKIIEVLDKLRIGLLELNVPDNSLEKNKRQKNAFEFAVRFSRNFLYPLKGMLEDLKSTPMEQFNSLTSNEACLRVCNLFSLLLQSVNTYQKQLRYFLLDHVPQKLPILIEMIYMTTSQCREKQIFSPQDVILDSLQQRCMKFFDFLQDLQDGQLNTMRENHRKLTRDKAKPKYDLKMFMNDLNMYEPKLVPKSSAKRGKCKPKRPIKSVPIEDLPDDTIKEKPQEDTIATQIEHVPLENKSSTNINLGSGDANPPGLDKSVLEALQNLTKEQVRKVLEPMLKSLSLTLGKQNKNDNSPLDTEAIVTAFQNKVFSTLDADKQLANDDDDDNKCYVEETTNNNNNKGLNVELSYGDSLRDISTCKPLKAAKSTKTQRQQNKQRRHGDSSNTATAAETAAAANSKTVAGTNKTKAVVCEVNGDAFKINNYNDEHNNDNNDDDDDDDSPNNINNDNNNNGNHHIKSNNTTNTLLLLSQSNSKHQSMRRNQQRINVVDNSNNTNTNDSGSGIGKQHYKQKGSTQAMAVNNSLKSADSTKIQSREHHGQRSLQRATATNVRESKINKSSKQLMNEVHNKDQMDQKLPREDKNRQQQQQKHGKHYWQCNVSPTNSQDDQGNSLHFNSGIKCNDTNYSSASSSDSEAGHNPKLKNIKTNPHYYQLQPRPNKFPLHTQRTSRNSSATLSGQSKRKTKKREPPPVPSVTPSSSAGHLSQKQYQISLEELKIPLTANASDLQSMQTFETFDAPLIEDDSDTCSANEYMAERTIDRDFQRCESKFSASKSCADLCAEGSIPLYPNKSPYNTSENTPRRLRPLPAKQLQKLQPKPSPKLITEQMAQSISFKENQIPDHEKGNMKSDKRFEQEINNRNQFLKLCEKNRFYKNPNFSEPWKVFSIISERLLNEALSDIENDFTAGVSKFVDDFLELEIKT